MTRAHAPAPLPQTVSFELRHAYAAISALTRMRTQLQKEAEEKWDSIDSYDRCQRSYEISRVAQALEALAAPIREADAKQVAEWRCWRDQVNLTGIHTCGDGRFLCPSCGPAGLDHVVCHCGHEITFWRDIVDPGHCDACLERRREENKEWRANRKAQAAMVGSAV